MQARRTFAIALMAAASWLAQGASDAATAAPPKASATAHPAQWPAAHSPAAMTNPAQEAQITAIMARMTLAQKVGQMIQGDISAITPADLEKYPLGSILAGGNSGPYGDERASAATWAKMVGEFRAASQKAGAGIPIIFGVDAVHGHSNLPGATIFPHNVGLGAINDPALIARIGAATADEVAGSGIDWTFAPTLAVPQDTRWGRSYEGYSSNPVLVARYGRAMVLGLQGTLRADKTMPATRVAATAKHYLADGGTDKGKDQGDAMISEAELVARHAQGYPAAIDAGALTVMASFSSWNGVKNHGNKTLLTDVLKGRMGFKGLVVGDWAGHAQVPGCTANDCAATFNAGLDMAMAPDSWKGLFDATLREAQDGTIPMARIDDAVRRILRVKAQLGLLGDTPTLRGNPARVGAQDHLALAREAVARSLVLLKNDHHTLPIRPGAKVLITGPGADNMAMQAGGWTITWQGTDTTAKDFPKGQTIGRAIADAVSQAGGTAQIKPEGTWDGQPDVAIVVYGEAPYAEFQGDTADLAFHEHDGEAALIKRLKAKGIRVVSLFLSGRPLFAGSYINASDAFVAGWLPGTQGQGVADVLVAARNGKPARDFTGRLPFAWPDDARSPIKTPLFRLGYGLSYAHGGAVPRVNEKPRVALAATINDSRYLVRGKVPLPWHMSLDSTVVAKPVDFSAQEDGWQLTWNGAGGVGIEGAPVDLTRQLDEGFVLRLDWRVDAMPAGPVMVSLGEKGVDLAPLLRRGDAKAPMITRIPLRCFKEAGADLKSVRVPVKIAADKGLVATVSSATIEAVGMNIDCPPAR